MTVGELGGGGGGLWRGAGWGWGECCKALGYSFSCFTEHPFKHSWGLLSLWSLLLYVDT